MRGAVIQQGSTVAALETAIAHCKLDLRGLLVLTEAATGAYAVTATLAALAGAQVYAYARDSRYASRDRAIAETAALAAEAGVSHRIEFPKTLDASILARADIVTNCGHLRPLCSHVIAALKPTAAIPLMYEAWEFRQTDLDLPGCRNHNIPVAGTNECHPAIDVFSFLGAMAARQLEDAGLHSQLCRVLLICDNPFRPHIAEGLTAAGYRVEQTDGPHGAIPDLFYDAVVVALRPEEQLRLDREGLTILSRAAHGALLAQFWGDIDRKSAADLEFRVWPPIEPTRGHMGILPSALGPEPIIRLQSGGLKTGEVMARAQLAAAEPSFDVAVEAAVKSGFGQRI